MLNLGNRCCEPPTQPVVKLSLGQDEQGDSGQMQLHWQQMQASSDFQQLCDLVRTFRSECLAASVRHEATSLRHEELLTRLVDQQLLVEKQLVGHSDIHEALIVTPALPKKGQPKNAAAEISSAVRETLVPPRGDETTGKSTTNGDSGCGAQIALDKTTGENKSSGGCFLMFRSFIHSEKFDMAMGVLIGLNIVFMCVDLEKKGSESAVMLLLQSNRGVWSNSDAGFELIEHIFNAVFFVELLLRIAAGGLRAFRSVALVFDLLIVTTSAIDYLTTYILDSSGANVNFLRVARLVKLVKLFKTFKAAAAFSELRILVRTLMVSLMALTWSCMLLFFILMTTSILLTQMLAGTISNEQAGLELRVWLFEYFGSFSRSFYTLFEATLGGRWHLYSRRMSMEVSIWYAPFWAVYVMIVVFAVMKVIGALFLEHTLKMAASDEEMMLVERQAEKAKYIEIVGDFLKSSDHDHDGHMNQEELDALLGREDVQVWLLKVGLEVHEVQNLFSVLIADAPVVNHADLLDNMMRLSLGARAMDTVMLMHQQRKMQIGLQELSDQLARPPSAAINRAVLS